MSDELKAAETPEILKVLANELRWQIIQHLKNSDYKVSELIDLTNTTPNQLSYHLAQMRKLEIVQERRSSADSRDVYYSLNIERLQALFQEAGDLIHPAMRIDDPSQITLDDTNKPVRMLFLCTHNSARSQIGEGLARNLGRGKIEAFSAGTEVTFVKPEAIEVMKQRGIDISQQESKHLDQFLDMAFDYVITVCDDAREACPIFPNGKHQLHWSFADPSAVENPDERLEAFEQVARQLTNRIHLLLLLVNRKKRS